MAAEEEKIAILRNGQAVGYAQISGNDVSITVSDEIINFIEEYEKSGAEPPAIFKEAYDASQDLAIDETNPAQAAKCAELLKAANKLKPNAEGNTFEEFWLCRAFNKAIFNALHERGSCKNLEFVTE